MKKHSEVAVWITGAAFGILAAVCHVLVPEQGLTLLWVMFSTMVLGFWEPRSPWRWILLVGLLVPAAAVFQKIMHPAQVSRAEVYGSFLALLPGIVGSYGGSFMRRMVQNIFLKKDA